MGKGIVSIPNLRAKDAMVRKQIYVRTIVMLNKPKRLIGSTQKGKVAQKVQCSINLRSLTSYPVESRHLKHHKAVYRNGVTPRMLS